MGERYVPYTESMDAKRPGWSNAMVPLIALLPDTGGCSKASSSITETASRAEDGLKENQKTD